MLSNENIISDIQKGIDVESNLYLLYSQNLPLIKRFSKKYANLFEPEDLMQECYIAFYQAVNGFDLEKECSFTSYLQTVIDRNLKRQYNKSALVRLKDNDLLLLKRYKEITAQYEMQTGKELSDNTACCLLECSQKQLNAIKQFINMSAPISAESPLGNDTEDISVIDTVQSDTDIQVEFEQQAMKEYALKLWDYVKELCTEQQATVLRYLYKQGLTYKQTAELMNISPSRVGNCQREAVKRLQRNTNVRRFAQAYIDIGNLSYKYGYNSFINNRASSVELEIERLERMLNNDYQMLTGESLKSNYASDCKE